MIDARPIYREFVAEALEGAIIQAEWCQRFLATGNDAEAEAAFRRMIEFVRRGGAQLKTISVHGQQARSTAEHVIGSAVAAA
jgi:hypothetical protein